MLWRILQEHNFALPKDCFVLFENTGKEHRSTLAFGERIMREWEVPITWLEYRRMFLPKYKSEARRLAAERARLVCGHTYEEADGRTEPGFVEVSPMSASTNGEPFHNVIDLMGLPNQNTRLCTSEMKIRVAKKFMLMQGYKTWTNVVGLRADEPRRLAKRKEDSGNRWDDVFPLARSGVRIEEVVKFWRSHPFDLDLPLDENGVTVGGNCDLCFLKAEPKKLRLIRDNESCVTWWEEQERRTGQTMRPAPDTYRRLHLRSFDSRPSTGEDTGDCYCHD